MSSRYTGASPVLLCRRHCECCKGSRYQWCGRFTMYGERGVQLGLRRRHSLWYSHERLITYSLQRAYERGTISAHTFRNTIYGRAVLVLRNLEHGVFQSIAPPIRWTRRRANLKYVRQAISQRTDSPEEARERKVGVSEDMREEGAEESKKLYV